MIANLHNLHKETGKSLLLEESALPEDAESEFFKNVCQFSGLWIGQYHGVELLSARVVIEHGVPKVCFTKVTGDPNVPAGRISLKTEGIPVPGSKTSTTGLIQMRDKIDDQDGFYWGDMSVVMPNLNTIIINNFHFKLVRFGYFTAIVSENIAREDILE